MISSHIIEKLLFCYLLKIIWHVSKCLKFYILHFLYLLCPLCRPKSAKKVAGGSMAGSRARHQNWLWHKNLVKIRKMQVKMAWDPYKSLEPPYLRYCTCHVFSFFNEHEFSIKFFVCGKSPWLLSLKKLGEILKCPFYSKENSRRMDLNSKSISLTKLLCPSKFQIYHGWVGIF